MNVLPTCMCVYLSEVRRGSLDPLQHELQMVVRYHIGAKFEPSFSARATHALKPLAVSPAQCHKITL